VLQRQLEDNYPVRGKGDAIEWARPQWVEGENEALHYRGRELKRGKMWFQSGEPQTKGFVKYYYVRSPPAPTRALVRDHPWSRKSTTLPEEESCFETEPVVSKVDDPS
jgi:hypothetical protein